MSPEEARAELVRRLREWNYKQGKYALKAVYPDGHAEHCCLGVAGEIVVEEGLCEWVPFDGQLNSNEAEELVQDLGVEIFALEPKDVRDTERYDVLPRSVKDFFGFREVNGKYDTHGYKSLAGDNDNGVPFEKIAERIETDPTLLSA